MRPLGHAEARERREHLLPTDSLQCIWERWWEEVNARHKLYRATMVLSYIAPFNISAPMIEYFILKNPAVHQYYNFGLFVTMAYQSLPENEIVYSLDTPGLNGLGVCLHGKHLIIEGNVGSAVGEDMIGLLTINGTVRSLMYDSIGENMIGAVSSSAQCTTLLDEDILGNRGGLWNIPRRQRERFLEDIMNPDGLSYNDLRSHLRERYRPTSGWMR